MDTVQTSRCELQDPISPYFFEGRCPCIGGETPEREHLMEVPGKFGYCRYPCLQRVGIAEEERFGLGAVVVQKGDIGKDLPEWANGESGFAKVRIDAAEPAAIPAATPGDADQAAAPFARGADEWLFESHVWLYQRY
ncbi:MAG: hypothetical protein WBN83_02330 [Desulfoprunum sp.]|jgi:hypothetical protein